VSLDLTACGFESHPDYFTILEELGMDKVIWLFIGIVIVCMILALIVAWPFMLIWNYAVVAAISVANPINFWQAFWLSVFCALFISGDGKSVSKE
jgi:hypothetical protein